MVVLCPRLLYPNPVCLLTVWADNDDQAPLQGKAAAAAVRPRRNVMTISWLTCINNQVAHTHHRTRTTAHAPPHTHHRTRTTARLSVD